MEMEISPGEDNAVQFRTSLISQLERDSTTPIPTRETIVQMCAWCDLVLVGGEWLSLEDAIWMMGLLDAQEAPPISHGMCANCIDALKIEARPKHHLAD